jgi:hypothetical protein
MEYFLFLDRDCIFSRSSEFCPRMAKEGEFVSLLATFY